MGVLNKQKKQRTNKYICPEAIKEWVNSALGKASEEVKMAFEEVKAIATHIERSNPESKFGLCEFQCFIAAAIFCRKSPLTLS